MKITKNYKIQKILILLFILCAVIISPPLLADGAAAEPSDSDPQSCARCHVMQAEYEAWIHSGAHRRKNCSDCHLPNENAVVYYLWKSIDGLKDLLIYHSGKIPEQIKISSHGEKVLQTNCIRCHETTVMLMDQKRKCWSCHRRISHMHAGIRETL